MGGAAALKVRLQWFRRLAGLDARCAADVNGFPLLALFVLAAAVAPTGHRAADGRARSTLTQDQRSALAQQVTLFLGINSLVYALSSAGCPLFCKALATTASGGLCTVCFNWQPPRRGTAIR